MHQTENLAMVVRFHPSPQIKQQFKMKKETITLIWKGILLYITMFITMIFIAGVDSLSNKGLIVWLIVIAILFYACKKAKYTDKELDIISGNTLINKLSERNSPKQNP